MKIIPVNNYYCCKKNNNAKQTHFCGFKSPTDISGAVSNIKDIFWGKPLPAQEYIEKGALLLNLIGNMTGIAYMNLTPKHKQILREITSDDIKRDAKVNYKFAHIFKQYLQEKYNNSHNCTILSIGRSLASICETMKYMGEDTNFLPMSGMTMASNYKFSDYQKSVYRDYLASIGLTKDVISKNPSHKYIIVDLVSSGQSLNNAYTFLSQPEILGSHPNLITLKSDDVFGLVGYLNGSILKRYSPVDMLPHTQIEEVNKAANPHKYNYRGYSGSYDQTITTLFKFYIFEMLDKNKELKSL